MPVYKCQPHLGFHSPSNHFYLLYYIFFFEHENFYIIKFPFKSFIMLQIPVFTALKSHYVYFCPNRFTVRTNFTRLFVTLSDILVILNYLSINTSWSCVKTKTKKNRQFPIRIFQEKPKNTNVFRLNEYELKKHTWKIYGQIIQTTATNIIV